MFFSSVYLSGQLESVELWSLGKNCKIERVHFKLGWALKIQWGSEYINHLNTEHLNTRCIWILDSMGDRYSNGKVKWLGGPFKYRTLGTINRLFSVWFSDHHSNTGPFDYQAQIYHFCTRLVRHSEGYFNGLDWYLNGGDLPTFQMVLL